MDGWEKKNPNTWNKNSIYYFILLSDKGLTAAQLNNLCNKVSPSLLTFKGDFPHLHRGRTAYVAENCWS